MVWPHIQKCVARKSYNLSWIVVFPRWLVWFSGCVCCAQQGLFHHGWVERYRRMFSRGLWTMSSSAFPRAAPLQGLLFDQRRRDRLSARVWRAQGFQLNNVSVAVNGLSVLIGGIELYRGLQDEHIFTDASACGRQYTWPDAHTHMFLVHVSHRTHAHSARLKLSKVQKVRVIVLRSPPCRSLTSLLNTSHCPFPRVLSSLASPPSGPWASSASMARSCRNSPSASARWSGSGRMANPLQTQVVSPSSPTSATWTQCTRRSIFPTATTISRARTAPPWSPPLTQKVCRTQEHPAAAKQQQAEFLQRSDLQASGNRLHIMCRVDQVLPRRSCKRLPRSRRIEKKLLRKNRSSKTSNNWWVVSASKRGILRLRVNYWLRCGNYRTK